MPDETKNEKSQRREMPPPERGKNIPKQEGGLSLEKEVEKEVRRAAEQVEARNLEAEIAELKKQIKEAGPIPQIEGERTEEQKQMTEGLLSRLLILAGKKGVGIAIREAEDIGDPYIVDRLHDLLAEPEHRNLFEGK